MRRQRSKEGVRSRSGKGRPLLRGPGSGVSSHLLASLHSVKDEGNHLREMHVGLLKRKLVVKLSGILCVGLLNTAMEMGGMVRVFTSWKPANDLFLSSSLLFQATLSADHWGGGSNTERASKGGEEKEACAEGPHSRGNGERWKPVPQRAGGYRGARIGGWLERKLGAHSVGEQRIEDLTSMELRG